MACWKGGMTRQVIVSLLALAVAGCGGLPKTITGTFILVGADLFEATSEDGCRGIIYGDDIIDAGIPVWVAGDHGQPIVETTLGAGHVVADECHFEFVLADVPAESIYWIKLKAGSVGFFPAYSDDELGRSDWQLDMRFRTCTDDPHALCSAGGTPTIHDEPSIPASPEE